MAARFDMWGGRGLGGLVWWVGVLLSAYGLIWIASQAFVPKRLFLALILAYPEGIMDCDAIHVV
ncbi:hypothetical protein ACS8YF_09105 [Salinisphaera sp. SWV1]|uniref:hypothetical protein n=1 Tax=Salinisphaera sp. SWV1 TaxID=3454139 RepID=UPI003F824934